MALCVGFPSMKFWKHLQSNIPVALKLVSHQVNTTMATFHLTYSSNCGDSKMKYLSF